MNQKLKKVAIGLAIFPWSLFLLAGKGIDMLYHALMGGCLGF